MQKFANFRSKFAKMRKIGALKISEMDSPIFAKRMSKKFYCHADKEILLAFLQMCENEKDIAKKRSPFQSNISRFLFKRPKFGPIPKIFYGHIWRCPRVLINTKNCKKSKIHSTVFTFQVGIRGAPVHQNRAKNRKNQVAREVA